MRLHLFSASLLVGLASQVLADLLSNPIAQPNLPTVAQARAAAAAAGIDLDNIQGDILVGMKKRQELFFFFSIVDVKLFKTQLRNKIAPMITTTTQLLDPSTQPNVAINIAFSSIGLKALNVTDDLKDPFFANGQLADAASLGDPGTSNWVPAFTGKTIHGVFLLASDTVPKLNNQLNSIQSTLPTSIQEVYRLSGSVRPGTEEGHEHFGYMDGISQPAVIGFNNLVKKPGQSSILPGVILLGEAGDSTTRPAWAKDGSFLAFRQLKQLVPEFNKYVADQAALNGLSPDLLGARMVGRWKSGAPIDLAPTADNTTLASDPNSNNDFTFAHLGSNLRSDQTRCPFSAHIRKTRPRADLTPVDTTHQIMRAGIPYGPELTPTESTSNTTTIERGLAFISYQSTLNLGFRFIQHSWANTPTFVTGKSDPTPGFDPIIGAFSGAPRFASGLIPQNSNIDLAMPDFITSRGGEYLLSPSLSALSTTLSA